MEKQREFIPKRSTAKKTLTMPEEISEELKTYKAFYGSSFTEALDGIGEDSGFENRKRIAKANGIINYYARPDQDMKLLGLARQGALKKA